MILQEIIDARAVLPNLKAQSKKQLLQELAHAASTTQLVPPRSRPLAMRPATTFPSRPEKEFSCQPT